MDGDESALIENADHVGQLLHLDDAAGAIGNAVIVAADRRPSPSWLTRRSSLSSASNGDGRQRLQLGLLGSERLGDDPLRRAVHAHVGDGGQPVVELGVEIVEIAEACGRGRSPGGCS